MKTRARGPCGAVPLLASLGLSSPRGWEGGFCVSGGLAGLREGTGAERSQLRAQRGVATRLSRPRCPEPWGFAPWAGNGGGLTRAGPRGHRGWDLGRPGIPTAGVCHRRLAGAGGLSPRFILLGGRLERCRGLRGRVPLPPDPRVAGLMGPRGCGTPRASWLLQRSPGGMDALAGCPPAPSGRLRGGLHVRPRLLGLREGDSGYAQGAEMGTGGALGVGAALRGDKAPMAAVPGEKQGVGKGCWGGSRNPLRIRAVLVPGCFSPGGGERQLVSSSCRHSGTQPAPGRRARIWGEAGGSPNPKKGGDGGPSTGRCLLVPNTPEICWSPALETLSSLGTTTEPPWEMDPVTGGPHQSPSRRRPRTPRGGPPTFPVMSVRRPLRARVRAVGRRIQAVSRPAAAAERDVRSSRAGGIRDGISQVPTNVPHGEAWEEEGERGLAGVLGSQGAPVLAEGQERPPLAPRHGPWVWLTWERGTLGSRCPRSSATIGVEPCRSEGRWGSGGRVYGWGSREGPRGTWVSGLGLREVPGGSKPGLRGSRWVLGVRDRAEEGPRGVPGGLGCPGVGGGPNQGWGGLGEFWVSGTGQRGVPQ